MANEKSKKGWIFGLIGGGVAIAIAVILAIVLNLKTVDPSDPTASISYTKAFFIYDKKYTLWNDEGKRLTEDEYSDTSSFVGGYAYVKKDDQVGIIRDNGKMSVEFGKYGSIVNKGGLYLAQDGNTKEYSLITGAGKELIRGNTLDVMTSTYTSGFAVAKSDASLATFDYTGRLIFETPLADDANNPAMNSASDFGIVYYAGKNYLFDVRDGRMIATFDGDRYTFDDVSENRKAVLLDNYSNSGNYKLFIDGKVYDLNEMEYYSFTAMDQLIGYDSMSEIALLGSDYQVVAKINSYVELKDSYNYAVDEENGVAIYRNGEKIKEFADSKVSRSGVMYEDYYAIEDDDKAVFYHLDGSAAFNHEFKNIKSLFDLHHLAVVSDGDDEYYLIDARGNRVIDYTADSFSVREGGYEVGNSENKYAVANKAGKLVTGFDYDDAYYRSSAEPRNIWTGEKSSKSYDVIDGETGQVIVSDVNVYDFSANYFVVKNSDGKKVYYTYTGVNFYTES